MGQEEEHEPVFIRSRWGTNRYVYNPNNPVGLSLIVGSVLFALGALYHLHDSSTWSEGELRDAVHEAAHALEAQPQTVRFYEGYEVLIKEAIEKTGEGPSSGGVRVSAVKDWNRKEDDETSDDQRPDTFEVRVSTVDTAYCLRISPLEPDTTRSSVTVPLSVAVSEGFC